MKPTSPDATDRAPDAPGEGATVADEGDALRIDIVSDVVCPWCIVGYRQLAIALERRGTRAAIHWHPFELNPDMPPEGEELSAHMGRKYGSSIADSARARERLVATGAELGFTFDYADGKRIVPTFRAHRLLSWAGESGREHALKMALFDAYFTRSLNVDDTDVLLDAAESIGLDREAARVALEDETRATAVREHERFWLAQGVRGVPAMVFDERRLVTGAQGVERYEAILEELAAASATV